MRNEQIKTASNSCYGWNWRNSTCFRVVKVNCKRKVNGKQVQIHVCRKRDA